MTFELILGVSGAGTLVSMLIKHSHGEGTAPRDLIGHLVTHGVFPTTLEHMTELYFTINITSWFAPIRPFSRRHPGYRRN